MKILYISTVFPRPCDSDTIYTDFAECLRDKGHELMVLVGEGSRKLTCTAWCNERGIKVLRVRTGNLYDVGLFEKGYAVATLKYRICRAIRKHLSGFRFDLVLFESPPLTMAGPAAFAMRKFKCPSYLILKDIFPQNALDLGILSRWHPAYLWFATQERKLYRKATWIGCMSEANVSYLKSRHSLKNPEKIEIFPNAKKIRYTAGRPFDYPMRRKYGIPENAVVAVFGGNMGKPQGLGFLMDVIANNKSRKDIFFLLVGRGAERPYICLRIKEEGLSNVLLLDSLPRNDYEQLVCECDIGLISLDKRFTIPNYPSRVLTYFEYRMPVLAALDKATDFGCMLDGSEGGLWSPAGDLQGFQKNLDILAADPGLRLLMGKKGRLYMEQHFTVDKAYEILMQHFEGEGNRGSYQCLKEKPC